MRPTQQGHAEYCMLPTPTIPKHIHQTWKDAQIPERFAQFQQSWQHHHPDWQYTLWTDADNLALIETHFPWFLPTYLSYPHPIQRVDAARYFIIRKFGGVYVDLDFECLKPVGPLIDGHGCVFGLEPTATANLFGRDMTIGNAFIAATPEHPAMHVLTSMLEPYLRNVHPMHEQVILETTGPFMLTHVYEQLPDPSLVTLVASKHLYPLTMQQADAFRGLPDGDQVSPQAMETARQRLAKAYAVHHHFGSWWRNG